MRRHRDHVARDRRVEQHAHEVLVVVEADAVGNPGAVVVHFEDALVALAAVVTAVGLALEAALAHANATIVLTLNWYHLETITGHRLVVTWCHAHERLALLVVEGLRIRRVMPIGCPLVVLSQHVGHV